MTAASFAAAPVPNDDSREKRQIGEQWEVSSGGRCLFLMAVADDNGRDVKEQIAEKIGLPG